VLSAGNQVVSIGMGTTLDFCNFLCLIISLFQTFFYCKKKGDVQLLFISRQPTSANSTICLTEKIWNYSWVYIKEDYGTILVPT
jgi:hypothetical protein